MVTYEFVVFEQMQNKGGFLILSDTLILHKYELVQLNNVWVTFRLPSIDACQCFLLLRMIDVADLEVSIR